MKPITINGEQWWYKTIVKYYEFNPYTITSFFRIPTITKKQRKYLGLFGPLVTVEVDNEEADFSIELDVEHPKHTKEVIKNAIDKEMVILKRGLEIKNGEII